MEKKIFAIKVIIDYIVSTTRSSREKGRYCEYYLPFYGTRQEAEAAALGLGQGCERQAKKFYDSGWKTIMVDTDILIDGAI